MLWMLLACADPIPALFEPETACDGLDNNGDGRIDEGVLAARFGVQEDLAGAPDLDTFSVAGAWSPGVRWVQKKGWSESYSGRVTESVEGWTLDEKGRLVEEYRWQQDQDGTSEYIFQAEYQGDVQVTLVQRVITDGADILEFGWRATVVEDGQVLAAELLIDGVLASSIAYTYDAQGRETWQRWVDAETQRCSAEARIYDDTRLTQETYYGASCSTDVLGEVNVFEQWDSAGRLVVFQDRTKDFVWSWGEDGVSVRTRQVGAESHERRFEYQDGRLLGGSDARMQESWVLGFDGQGRVSGVATLDLEHKSSQLASLRYARGEDAGVVSQVRYGAEFSAAGDVVFELDESGNLALETGTFADGQVYEFKEWTHGCQAR